MRIAILGTTSRRGAVLARSLAVVALAGALLAADKKTVLPADQARDHVDEEGTFEMVVRLTKNFEPGKVYYLDSEADYHDEKNLAVVISYDDAKKFKDAGVDDPTTYYKGKTIRVTGKVIRESQQTRIRVKETKQISVVKKEKNGEK